jgi:hypothetical protein
MLVIAAVKRLRGLGILIRAAVACMNAKWEGGAAGSLSGSVGRFLGIFRSLNGGRTTGGSPFVRTLRRGCGLVRKRGEHAARDITALQKG